MKEVCSCRRGVCFVGMNVVPKPTSHVQDMLLTVTANLSTLHDDTPVKGGDQLRFGLGEEFPRGRFGESCLGGGCKVGGKGHGHHGHASFGKFGESLGDSRRGVCLAVRIWCHGVCVI